MSDKYDQFLTTYYIMRHSVAIEDFDDGSLIFLPQDRRLIKLNRILRNILRRMDGKQPVRHIIHKVADIYDVSFDAIWQDVAAVLTDLERQTIIRDVGDLYKIKGFSLMEDVKYTVNHDVSCRIEEPDGAILFNPETDVVQVINPVGLAIWQALGSPCGKQEVVEYLVEICEGVPEEQVVQDVDEFIEKLKSAGFVGEVIE